MLYPKYQDARDMAWKILIKHNVSFLPVDLNALINKLDISVILYSQSDFIESHGDKLRSDDGFVVSEYGKPVVFLNDKINNTSRRRFTLAHELGHVLLGHNLDVLHFRHSELDNREDFEEAQANIFARDILMPATVLADLNVHSFEEIMRYCLVSKQSAEIRLKRMEELYGRNMFNRHPLEREVRKQFDGYIKRCNQMNK